MKNIIIAISVLMISSIQLFSQSYDNLFINPLWNFYSFNYLSTVAAGRGFTGIASVNDISGFNLNPATVEIPSKNQINVQYTYKTSQPWLKDSPYFDNLSLNQQVFSGSIGYGRKINKNLQIGLIYNNPTSVFFDLGERIKTNEFGTEIGRYDSYYDISSHSFNIPVIYKVNDFRFGLNLNYLLSMFKIPGEAVTTLNNPDGFDDGTFTGTSHYFQVHAGMIYSVKNKFSIGAKVVTGGKSIVKNVYPDGSEGEQTSMATYPWRAGAGIQFSVTKVIRVLADYNFENTSMLIGLKDRHDGHIGVEGNIHKSWVLRAGFFTLFDYRIDEENVIWLEHPGEYDQLFLSIGTSYQQKNLEVNLAILTSEISTGIIKNTYLNCGLTFNF